MFVFICLVPYCFSLNSDYEIRSHKDTILTGGENTLIVRSDQSKSDNNVEDTTMELEPDEMCNDPNEIILSFESEFYECRNEYRNGVITISFLSLSKEAVLSLSIRSHRNNEDSYLIVFDYGERTISIQHKTTNLTVGRPIIYILLPNIWYTVVLEDDTTQDYIYGSINSSDISLQVIRGILS